MKKGILLINLGTPSDPSPNSVKSYLKEFLNDPYVINLPSLLRRLFVNYFIIPLRFKRSSLAYQKIWTEEGSPLLVNTMALQKKLIPLLSSDFVVKVGMRYGKPSIRQAMKEFEKQNIQSIFAIPLYPQFAESSTQTAIDETHYWAKKYSLTVQFKSPFYTDPGFIVAQTETIRPLLMAHPDAKIIFSFHGLPETHILKLSKSCKDCLTKKICHMKNTGNCYRAQCFKTADLIAKNTGLKEDQYFVSFQSRLGPVKWIEPYTDEVLKSLSNLPKSVVIVSCPSFTADCLETLEEIAIVAKKNFKAMGGNDLFLAPSLNTNETWVETVAKWSMESNLTPD